METGTIELIIIGVLIGIIVLQQGFHMWQTHRLVDRIMSRNYADYALANRPLEPQGPNMMRIELPDQDQHEDLRRLNDMIKF